MLKAMVLAAGRSTRMRPLSDRLPKALFPVNGIPMIHYQMSWLGHHGVQEVMINLHHLGDMIETNLGNSYKGIALHYSHEEELLGTAGGVKKVESFFTGSSVIVYGDILTDMDLSRMIAYHRQKKAVATIGLMPTAHPSECGIVQLNEDGRVLDFTEKPPEGTEKGNLANCGIYVIEKEVLDLIPKATFFDFGFDVFGQMISAGIPAYGYELRPDEYIIDIGTKKNYAQANSDMREGRVRTDYYYQ